MPFIIRSPNSRRHLGLNTAFVLALSLAATSTALAQSAYQPGWSGARSDVIVDLSVIDGGASNRIRLQPTRTAQVTPAQPGEVIVDLSVLDALGPVEPANERRMVLHRPTPQYAAVGHHFHLRQLAHRAHRHVAHRSTHSGIKLAAAAKTKASDAQCCPVPGAR